MSSGSPLEDASFRLLALLARADPGPGAAARARELLAASPDPDRLLELAGRHHLTPLVGVHLERLEAPLPDGFRERLRILRLANAARVLEVVGQLLELLEALRSREVVAVPYKGPALGAQVYGSAAHRHAGDLDVFVHPRDVPTAREILRELGYRSRVRLTRAQVRFMIRNRYHEEYLHVSRERGDSRLRAPIELHWAFSNRDFPFAPDPDAIMARAGRVVLGGREVPVFDPADLLLLLSVHGAKHRWDRLEWIAGFGEVVRLLEDADWDAIASRAAELGVRRTLTLGLLLAAGLVDAPVPPPVLGRARSDRVAVDLAAEVRTLLSRPPAGWEVPDRLQRDRFRMRIRERRLDRWRGAWHRAMTPSDPAKWAVLPVGPWDLPAHVVARPFRVVAELATALRPLLPSGRT